MKKKTSFILLAAATLALGFMGCSQDETQGGDSNGKTLTFVGSSSSNTEPGAGAKAGTRTNLGNASLTSSGFQYYWTSGDKIWVGTTPTQSDAVSTSGSNSGTFTVTGATTNSGTSYDVLYTGNGSTSGTSVKIKCMQAQLAANNSDHIGTDGDCATATAVQDASDNTKYNFKLDHKSAYLMLMPFSGTYAGYKLQSVQVIADQNVAGTYSFSSAGLGTTPTSAIKYVAVNAGEFGQGTFTIPSSKSESDAMYVVIAPQTVGSLKCIYTIVNGSTIKSIEKTVVSSSTELKANTLYRIGANLDANGTEIAQTATSPGYYEWDAVDGKNYLQTYSTDNDYNGTTAQYVCADCPTVNQIKWYIKGGVYWGTGPTFTAPDGSTTTNGMWFRKKSDLINPANGRTAVCTETQFDESADGGTDYTEDLITTAPSDADLKANWFFLPASSEYIDGVIYTDNPVGTMGCYWSNTLDSETNDIWCLEFSDINCGLWGYGGKLGYRVWGVR